MVGSLRPASGAPRLGAPRRLTELGRLRVGRLRELGLAALLGGLALSCSCDRDEPEAPSDGGDAPSAQAQKGELTEEQRRAVLAKVGDRVITLGEYVQTLARREPFERMRYQSPERRRRLHAEMIEVELLAQEAQRRGLDRQHATRLRVQEILRDEVRQAIRRELPDPAELPEREVRAYYDAHRDEFREPERRRVLHIAVGTRELAQKIAREAQGASGARWAELAKEHSLDRRGTEAGGAPELAGDLGLVSAPGETRGENPLVLEPLRKAVFELKELGDVAPEPVFAGGQYHVVRFGGLSGAKDRSYAEAERLVRLELLRARLLEREAQLEAQLRERFEVKIDEAAVRALRPGATKATPESPPAPEAPTTP